LLNDVVIMEQNGLEKCWVSDHYIYTNCCLLSRLQEFY
jgi:hypothetical protein